MTTTTAPETVAIHPLLARPIRPLRNWAEWLVRWDEAPTSNELLGLLHVGFDVYFGRFHGDKQDYVPEDRIAFYLDVADGWNDAYFKLNDLEDDDTEYFVGYDGSGNRKYASVYKLRGELAEKANRMLCMHFFKRSDLCMSNADYETMYWWRKLVENDELFPKIMHFFRFEKDRIINLGKSDAPIPQQHTHSFLMNLAKFLWMWCEEEIHSYDPLQKAAETNEINGIMRRRVEEAKLWIIEVLAQLKQLDTLEPWFLELSEPCLDKLREIALRSELRKHSTPVNKSRLVATIEEACLAGSKAAWFLEKHRIMKRELERLTEIQEAERAQKAAAQRVEELTGAK